jgi:hypothetical protein
MTDTVIIGYLKTLSNDQGSYTLAKDFITTVSDLEEQVTERKD